MAVRRRRGEDARPRRGVPPSVAAGSSVAAGWRLAAGPSVAGCRRAARFRPPFFPQVNEFDLRQTVPRDALVEFEQMVSARPCVLPALQRRRRGTEDAEASLNPRAHDRDGAGVIARHVGLLVAALVLLVDDDGAKPRNGREDGRPRPDRDPLPPLPQAAPGVETLPVRESGVEDGDRIAEAGAKPPHRLRRERDLRHEQDPRPPSRELALEDVEIDHGLPRPGDAAQQRHPPRVRRAEPVEGRYDPLLVGRERDRDLRLDRARERISRHHAIPELGDLLGHETGKDGAAKPELVHEMADGGAPAHGFQRLVQLALAMCPSEQALALGQRAQLAHEPDHALGLGGGGSPRDRPARRGCRACRGGAPPGTPSPAGPRSTLRSNGTAPGRRRRGPASRRAPRAGRGGGAGVPCGPAAARCGPPRRPRPRGPAARARGCPAPPPRRAAPESSRQACRGRCGGPRLHTLRRNSPSA